MLILDGLEIPFAGLGIVVVKTIVFEVGYSLLIGGRATSREDEC